MVRSRLCWRVRPRIVVRFSSRCVAFWDCGSDLVCGCRPAMVAEGRLEMKSTATGNQPIVCTLIEDDFREGLGWIAECGTRCSARQRARRSHVEAAVCA